MSEWAAGVATVPSEDLASVVAHVSESVVGVVDGVGEGAGVVWGDDLVVTNHHVVPGEQAVVVLADGSRLAAEVVARDERSDLAALRVPDAAGRLRPADVRATPRLRTGELVVAIGNPLGLRNVPTVGLVAGEVLPIVGGHGERTLQLAIRLRPGNSGGALADMQGRVVGIPHLVVGGDLGVAVPSDEVDRFLGRAAPPDDDGLTWV